MKIWTAWNLLPLWGVGLVTTSFLGDPGMAISLFGAVGALTTFLIVWDRLLPRRSTLNDDRNRTNRHDWPLIWELMGLSLASALSLASLTVWGQLTTSIGSIDLTNDWDTYPQTLLSAIVMTLILAPLRRDYVRTALVHLSRWMGRTAIKVAQLGLTAMNWVFLALMVSCLAFGGRVTLYYANQGNYPAAISLFIIVGCLASMLIWLMQDPRSRSQIPQA